MKAAEVEAAMTEQSAASTRGRKGFDFSPVEEEINFVDVVLIRSYPGPVSLTPEIQQEVWA